VVADGAGRLYLVSTPIGNLGDVTLRALETLRSAALILAEDTRHTRPFLQRFEIATPVESYHEHNEARMVPRVVERLRAGASVALVSDAGTPLLSDPGARLVSAAVEAGIAVVPIPGASALLAALVASGLDATRFTFFGFLPRKGRERAAALAEIAALPHTAVVYEAPGRVADTLRELAGLGGGERDVVVARELTKQFEELRRGTVEALASYYDDAPLRGEVVLVVGGAPAPAVGESELLDRARELRERGMSARDVAATLVAEHGAARNVAYRLAHEVS
jgi:16S rRNA (cytidine1402-2'-O)-methyltransferase